jgi:hypothetical protein
MLAIFAFSVQPAAAGAVLKMNERSFLFYAIGRICQEQKDLKSGFYERPVEACTTKAGIEPKW